MSEGANAMHPVLKSELLLKDARALRIGMDGWKDVSSESDRALMTMVSITKEWRKRTCGTFRTAGDIDAST